MIRALNLVLFLLILTKGFACTCIEPKSSPRQKIQIGFEESDVVLIGKVMDIRIPDNSGLESSADLIVYKFKVESGFKGAKESETIEIASYRDGSFCAIIFERGGKYLVYSKNIRMSDAGFRRNAGKEKRTVLLTTICDRSKGYYVTDKKELKILDRLSED